jgi:hypothetical protein
MLEGSGGTTADGKGSNTGTLDTSVTWTSDSDGALLNFSDNTVVRPILLASLIVLSTLGANDWSVAWRGKQTVSNVHGICCGTPTTNDYIAMFGGVSLEWEGQQSAPLGLADFTSLTDFTAQADYVLSAVSGQLHLYKNGVETADSPITPAGLGFGVNTLGNGNDLVNDGLIGQLSYVGFWVNRALTASEAGLLHTDPYGTMYQMLPIKVNIQEPVIGGRFF